MNYLLVTGLDSNIRAANEEKIIEFYISQLREGVALKMGSDSDVLLMLPSLVEFTIYYKMATQGIVYRCLAFNLFMSHLPLQYRHSQLNTVVERTCSAILDTSLYSLLAVGRTR